MQFGGIKYSGIIRTFFPNRHFGFIVRGDDAKDIFFHQTDFHGMPTLGQQVEFELGPAVMLGKPEQAVRVKPIASAVASTALTNQEAVTDGR